MKSGRAERWRVPSRQESEVPMSTLQGSMWSETTRMNGSGIFTRTQGLSEHRVKRILVADGEAEVRGMLAGELEEAGYAVDVCKNGLDALSRLYFEEFDAVVASWRLPVRDGIFIAGAVKEMQESKPVILLTEPESDAWVRKRVARLGAICLPMPFSIRRFRELLRLILTR
jgi:CheY-like chemotaxis protein